VNIGQNTREIPGLPKDVISEFEDVYTNPELKSAESMEQQKKDNSRHLDTNIPDPWDGKW